MPAFRNPTYETRDGVIPIALFEVLMPTLDPIETGIQLRTANAVSHGYALAKVGKDLKVKRFTKEMVKRAYPVVYGRGETGEDEHDG